MEELQLAGLIKNLPARTLSAHKGDFGHVLVVGGEEGFSGAVILAAMAALRTGAGCVSIATRSSHAHALNVNCPEIMCHGVETAASLLSVAARATVIVAGPGLGQGNWGRELLGASLAAQKPLVIDADGLIQLQAFAADRSLHREWILTPHPGEAGRLLGISTAAVQKDRLMAVQSLQHQLGGIVVLKGAGTLVTDLSGQPALCRAGNPGMATAGMGDVLSGVIGGLLAQGLTREVSARLGVLVHAMAGDRAAQDAGQRGMLASDLFLHVRSILNEQ